VLVLPSVGQRPDRPDVTSGIPNLMLAGDYLNGDWQVANMECAQLQRPSRRQTRSLI
jgi:uncharacterized protein with NAD-binding domain and iron-sulfur cluster